MNNTHTSQKLLVRLSERLVGLLACAVLCPTMMVVALLIRCTSTGAILVADEVHHSDGTVMRSYRFRTTGSGTVAFRKLGRLLRRFSLDELPAFWSLACGEVRLNYVLGLLCRLP